jgi:hypothetical protein
MTLILKNTYHETEKLFVNFIKPFIRQYTKTCYALTQRRLFYLFQFHLKNGFMRQFNFQRLIVLTEGGGIQEKNKFMNKIIGLS